MTASNDRPRVCAQARAWLGRNEADGSFREIIDVYNAHRPAGSYKMTYADPWCAAFVSAVGMESGCAAILPHVNCEGMIAAYKAAGRWVEADDYPAKPGDLLFYDWQDSGVGDCKGEADHVGIIVEDNEYYFTVIEGNCANAVQRRTLAHNSRFIRGFAVPAYEGEGEGIRQEAEENKEPDKAPTVQPEAGTCTVTLPLLREGDKGEAVRNLQRLLIARGYYCGGYMSYNGREKPDGEFGPKTGEAVELFQASCEIASDKIVGAVTWAALITTT